MTSCMEYYLVQVYIWSCHERACAAPADSRARSRRPCPARVLRDRRALGFARQRAASPARRAAGIHVLQVEARTRRRAFARRARTHQLCTRHLQEPRHPVSRARTRRRMDPPAEHGADLRRAVRLGPHAVGQRRRLVRGAPVPRRAARLGLTVATAKDLPEEKRIRWTRAYRIVP